MLQKCKDDERLIKNLFVFISNLNKLIRFCYVHFTKTAKWTWQILMLYLKARAGFVGVQFPMPHNECVRVVLFLSFNQSVQGFLLLRSGVPVH